MASAQPENMLPILIVLGVMFLGICVAMNLFSRLNYNGYRSSLQRQQSPLRARFKKQRGRVFTGNATLRAKNGQQQRPGSALRTGSPASTSARKYHASASPTSSSVKSISRATPTSGIRYQPAPASLKDRLSAGVGSDSSDPNSGIAV